MNNDRQSKALDEIHDHAVTLLELLDTPKARDVVNEIIAVARYKYPMGRKFLSSNDTEGANE